MITRRGALVVTAAVACGAVVACFFVVPHDRPRAVDPAVASVITGYEAGVGHANSLPADSVATVQQRLSNEKADASWRPTATEAHPGDVLPPAAVATIDARYSHCLSAFCTARLAAESQQQSLSGVIGASLYNNPGSPPVVDEQTKVMAVESEALVTDTSGPATDVVWAYVWRGDVTTAGKGSQDWCVNEYRLVQDDGRWRIDSISQLRLVTATDSTGRPFSDEWGPTAPHESVTQSPSDCRGSSSVHFPSEAREDEMLAALETKAGAVIVPTSGRTAQ